MKTDPSAAREKSVVLITGSEDFLRMQFLAELLKSSETEDDFDTQSFTADSKPFDEWIASAGTAPFLADRRTVIVRNLLRCEYAAESAESAISLLKGLPATSQLILVVDDESGDDNRQRRLLTLRKAWETAVSKGRGGVFSFDSDPKALRSKIRTELAASGKTISAKAIEALIERCANSASASLSEIEKLVVYSNDEPEIREADVIAAVSPSYEWSVFRMIDAALAGNSAEAQKQLRILVGGATKAEEAAQRNIFPVLSKQLKLIWQARACIEAKTDVGRAPQGLLDQFPSKPNLKTEAEWSQRRAMRSAQSLRFSQLAEAFDALTKADAKLKGQFAAFSSMDTMEQFLLEIASIARGQQRPLQRA